MDSITSNVESVASDVESIATDIGSVAIDVKSVGIHQTILTEQKANTVVPAYLVAEAISTLNGLDLRWSGPITPSEMQYVQQYVLAKYPEYCNGLVEEGDKINLDALCANDESS
ncbi:hypothetical protein CQW23_26063 [Capsicum baccatum]|uniref:Uncharacterized protein n=1 Tax=Capsicum baccatum TaxID=33114 RepID=A0A2G2VMS0_CAPBA|nr:hypothetical protein CQW23_26063 [Capsicum baccatum]